MNYRGQFIIFMIIPYFCCGLYIKLNIQDDEAKQNYEHVLTDDDFEENPPFRIPENTGDISGKQRHRVKRMRAEGRNDEELTVRTEPQCTQRMRQIQQRTKGQPVQLAYVVEPGENIRLMCHYCGDANKWYKVMVWKRIVRKANKRGKFWIEDVKLDYHDDENRNRIFTTYDHSLVIKNISEVDVDTYFCHDKKRDALSDEEITKQKMEHLFSTTDKFRFYYHVDVVPTTSIPAKLVSESGDKHLKPAPPEEDQSLNLKYFTTWERWTPCSVCGQVGERRSRGSCMATLLDRKSVSDPPYIFYALRSFAIGMPCRSTIFLPYSDRMTNRSDEIKLKECDIKCKNISLAKGRGLSINIEKISFMKNKTRENAKQMNVSVGDKVEMECPGATLDDMVYWVNASRYISSLELSNSSMGRAGIDVYGRFHIYSSEITDSGKYECWYRNRKHNTINLSVMKPHRREEWRTYLLYLLLSYMVDFCIFMAFVSMKHKHRQVQTTDAYYRRQVLPKDDTQQFKENTEYVECDENEVEERWTSNHLFKENTDFVECGDYEEDQEKKWPSNHLFNNFSSVNQQEHFR